MHQPLRLAIRPPYLHTCLDVQLVETEPRNACSGRGLADGLAELVNGGHVRQVVRIRYQVPQGDQCVRLAAAIGQLKLAHGLVVLPRHPEHHVSHQLAQVVGRERQCKEPLRVLVDGALAALHHDLVQVSGKHVQRQLAGLQVLAQRHHFMPGLPGGLCHHRDSSVRGVSSGFPVGPGNHSRNTRFSFRKDRSWH